MAAHQLGEGPLITGGVGRDEFGVRACGGGHGSRISRVMWITVTWRAGAEAAAAAGPTGCTRQPSFRLMVGDLADAGPVVAAAAGQRGDPHQDVPRRLHGG